MPVLFLSFFTELEKLQYKTEQYHRCLNHATAIIDKIFVDYDRRLRPFYGGEPVKIFISMGFISISNIIEENMVTISYVYLSTSRTQNYSLFVAYQ